MIPHFSLPLTGPRRNQGRKFVDNVLGKSDALRDVSDAELLRRSLALRFEVSCGRPLHPIATDGFALVREAARRHVGMEHYPVQLFGGWALHHGCVAVMQTGEGKTLTATLPLYLAALGGAGAHLATANDYLAQRDAEFVHPIFRALGLAVSSLNSDSSRSRRREAYGSDILYTTAKELGFDFLRDRMADRRQQSAPSQWLHRMLTDGGPHAAATDTVQRELNFLLVDEADSIMVDEARTPLVVSSQPDALALAEEALFRWSAEQVEEFSEGEHFRRQPPQMSIELTSLGRKRVRTLSRPAELQQTPLLDLYEQIERALHVQEHFQRDQQYVIRDGEVAIVDEFTGRIAEGRKWRDGIHQTIEAAEGLPISVKTGEAARMTIQDLLRKYHRLAGMTGTAAGAELELRSIYGTPVQTIPTNRPPQRKAWPTMILASGNEKWQAIADEVQRVHELGRPVLVGTRTIEQSENLSQLLSQRGLTHDVLNARDPAAEAGIVAQAGQLGRITVATNMAGRGTDIRLTDESIQRGGLHVICSEFHESPRVDRQLIGRCGRQGDPGSYRQFGSLEDEILKEGLSRRRFENLRRWRDSTPERLFALAGLFAAAQRRVQRRHFLARKQLLQQEEQRHQLQRELGQNPYLDAAGAV